MSATPSHAERLAERIASLEARIERLQAMIVSRMSRALETVDLEQTLALLMEARRTYIARLDQIQHD